MSAVVAILVPVLDRPQNARPLVECIHFNTPEPHEVVFLCSPGDDVQIRTCRKLDARTEVVPFDRADGDYARKVNYGVSVTETPWVFHGADDLYFHPEWLTAALSVAQRRRRRVVGTNDLGNSRVLRGVHSTHSLVARSYIEEVGTVDEPGKLLHEGYRHNFVDTELIHAATWRREFVFCRESVVEHLHPNWGKSEMDATYELALDMPGMIADRQLFRKRRILWRAPKSRRR